MLKNSRKRGIFLLSALLAVPVAGAGPWSPEAAPPQPRRGAVTDHVVVVSIDGLRPDAIGKYGAHTLQRLRSEGAYDSLAQTILPSKTLPSHVSMLTGLQPERHGVNWNEDRTGDVGTVKVATVFEIAKQHGFTTAAFFSKPKFRHLQKAGTLDYTQAPKGLETWMATKTVPDAIAYLKARRPNLLFVHIAEPDFAGHTIGWMSFGYGWAVRRADGAVSKLVQAADAAYGKGKYTLIVTADHGGHGREHGTEDPRDTTIPWLAWGQGVSDILLPATVNTTDTAATILWLLGLRAPADWTGSAVAAAFTPQAQGLAMAAVAAQPLVPMP